MTGVDGREQQATTGVDGLKPRVPTPPPLRGGGAGMAGENVLARLRPETLEQIQQRWWVATIEYNNLEKE